MVRRDRISAVADAGPFRPTNGQTLRDFMDCKAYEGLWVGGGHFAQDTKAQI